MKKLMMIMVAIALAAIMVSPVSARMGMRGGYGHGTYGAADLTAVPNLNLTAEQVAKLNALRDAHLRDIQPLRNEMYSKRGELRLLWLERSPDQSKILASQRGMQSLRDKLFEKGTTYRLETLKVLTPEQQAQVQAYGPGRGYGYGKGMRGHGGMGMRSY